MIEKLGISLSYSREQLEKIFAYANANDVSIHNGLYDARSAAINVWSHGFNCAEASLIASFYFRRDVPKLWQIEVHPPHDLHKAIRELRQLETAVFGKVINAGKVRHD